MGAERDEAPSRAAETDQCALHLEHKVDKLKKDLEGAQGHVVSEVKGKKNLEKADFDLEGLMENMCQLEIEFNDACDELDRMEWKLESAERDAELQAARVKEHAWADHKKELDARDELITLLKEELNRLSGHKAGDAEAPPRSSSKGSGCPPDSQPEKITVPVSSSGRTVGLSLPILPTFSGEENRDIEDLFERWVRKLEIC